MHPIIQEWLPELRELCRSYHVARLDVFGSGASERFDAARSDLDFVVEYLSVPGAMTISANFGFKEALEQLFRREVDLVERAAVSNPYFQEELDETQVRSIRRGVLKLLEDIRVAATSIQEYTTGFAEADYLGYKLIRRAVERELEIIGEALRRLSGSHPDVSARVTEIAQIIGFRNVLARGYAALITPRQNTTFDYNSIAFALNPCIPPCRSSPLPWPVNRLQQIHSFHVLNKRGFAEVS